jgi:prepilin-type N-terminal cleavage/methylation domain-containing protein
MKNRKGFTLIELLVVIAILALLMSIIVITLNPAEMLRKTRDTKRVSDLNSLMTALNFYIGDKATPDMDGSTACGTDVWYSLSAAPATVSQSPRVTPRVVAAANLYKVDGTGWIPVNFNSISSGSPLSNLPVDPTNATSTTATSNYYYTYACNSTSITFELNAQMESTYYKSTGDGDVVSKDGGNDTTNKLYEVGSDLTLIGTPAVGFYQWP